jgi:hypothetical protein
MIVKVKHTKNGNVKITMSLEQAEYLLDRLGTRYDERQLMTPMQVAVLDHMELEMLKAGIEPRYN